MSNSLMNDAYALLVGVHEFEDSRIKDLPAVQNDVSRLRRVLLDPTICGYREENVITLLGRQASKRNILNALKDLARKVEYGSSDQVTVWVYFSSHGYLSEMDSKYYLIPYDADSSDDINLANTALKDEDMTRQIEKMNVGRLMIMFDTCHAGASEIGGFKQAAVDTSKFVTNVESKSTLSEEVLFGEAKPTDPPGGPEPLDPDTPPGGPKPQVEFGSVKLSLGEGRVYMASSRGEQFSYTGRKRMSLFTQALVESLQGLGSYATTSMREDKHQILITDVMSYVTLKVPELAGELNWVQNPTFKLDGESFPIAMLLGGKGLSGANPVEVEEAPEFTAQGGGDVTTVEGDQSFIVQKNKDSNISVNYSKDD